MHEVIAIAEGISRILRQASYCKKLRGPLSQTAWRSWRVKELQMNLALEMAERSGR